MVAHLADISLITIRGIGWKDPLLVQTPRAVSLCTELAVLDVLVGPIFLVAAVAGLVVKPVAGWLVVGLRQAEDRIFILELKFPALATYVNYEGLRFALHLAEQVRALTQ